MRSSSVRSPLVRFLRLRAARPLREQRGEQLLDNIVRRTARIEECASALPVAAAAPQVLRQAFVDHAVDLLEPFFAPNGRQTGLFQVLAVTLDRGDDLVDAVAL